MIIQICAMLSSCCSNMRGIEWQMRATALRRSITYDLRGLIDAIVLTPDGDSLRIELQGNLAAMLKAAEAQKTGEPLPAIGNWNETSSLDDDKLVQIMLVAGGGFEPPTFGL